MAMAKSSKESDDKVRAQIMQEFRAACKSGATSFYFEVRPVNYLFV